MPLEDRDQFGERLEYAPNTPASVMTKDVLNWANANGVTLFWDAKELEELITHITDEETIEAMDELSEDLDIGAEPRYRAENNEGVLGDFVLDKMAIIIVAADH